jgi:mRNA interferase MazF
MANFKAGDVVKVPFPYTDRATRQHRPALVISAPALEDTHGLLWVSMITSAENRAWPSDVTLSDLAGTGLPVPSLIRTAKIATIEARDAEALGRINPALQSEVHRRVAEQLGI